MMQYLRHVYNQEDDPHRFQLEYETVEYNQGGERRTSGLLLWVMTFRFKYASLIHATVPDKSVLFTRIMRPLNFISYKWNWGMNMNPVVPTCLTEVRNLHSVPAYKNDFVRNVIVICKSQGFLNFYLSNSLMKPNTFQAKDKRNGLSFNVFAAKNLGTSLITSKNVSCATIERSLAMWFQNAGNALRINRQPLIKLMLPLHLYLPTQVIPTSPLIQT